MVSRTKPLIIGNLSQSIRPTLVITFFTLVSQAIGFITQVVIAAIFGAGSAMDAFLAANTLPQYIIAVLLSALSFVFIPVFIDYISTDDEEDAWQVASTIINLCLLCLGALSVIGVLFSNTLLVKTTPGLSSESLQLATRIAQILWPTTMATGIMSLLSGIYQARGHFGWPATVPVIGAIINLLIIILFAKHIGIISLAISSTASITFQTILLIPILLKHKRYRLIVNLKHPGVQQVLRLLTPLVISSLLIRWTPVVDRYLASNLGEGSISHLGYAFKLLTLLSVLISAGITTVVFPTMALNSAIKDLHGLKHTLSSSLRIMWLLVAPTIAIGIAIAYPLVTTLLQRGQFNNSDSIAVTLLIRIYFLALIGMALGNITGRTFYALKDTRTLAIMGVVEALSYVWYATTLSRHFEALGIAFAYVFYFNVSLLWQLFFLRYKIGKAGGKTIITSFLKTGFSAGLGGVAAWIVTLFGLSGFLQLVLGGIVGVTVFVVLLLQFGSAEGQRLINAIVQQVKSRIDTSIVPT